MKVGCFQARFNGVYVAEYIRMYRCGACMHKRFRLRAAHGTANLERVPQKRRTVRALPYL